MFLTENFILSIGSHIQHLNGYDISNLIDMEILNPLPHLYDFKSNDFI